MAHTFSYIVEFRGGTYCSQVQAEDLNGSLQNWLARIGDEQAEIRHLDEKTLEEVANIVKNEDEIPIMLRGLKNIWFMYIPTSKGAFNINIVQTDLS